MEKQLTAEQILKVIKHDLFYQKRLTEPCLKMINDYSTSSQEVKQENKEVWTLNDSDIIDKIETIIYDNVGFNATFGNMTGIDNAVSEIMHLFRFYQKYSVSSLPKQVLNVTDEQIKPDGWIFNVIFYYSYESALVVAGKDDEKDIQPVYFSPVSQTKGLDITDEEIGGKK